MSDPSYPVIKETDIVPEFQTEAVRAAPSASSCVSCGSPWDSNDPAKLPYLLLCCAKSVCTQCAGELADRTAGSGADDVAVACPANCARASCGPSLPRNEELQKHLTCLKKALPHHVEQEDHRPTCEGDHPDGAVEATEFCAACSQSWCAACSQGVHRFLKNHKPVALDSSSNSSSNSSSGALMCRQHGFALTQYCLDCPGRPMVCDICVAGRTSAHFEHKAELIRVVDAARAATISTEVAALKAHDAVVRDAVSVTMATAVALGGGRTGRGWRRAGSSNSSSCARGDAASGGAVGAARAKIRTEFAELRALLQQHEDALLAQLHSFGCSAQATPLTST